MKQKITINTLILSILLILGHTPYAHANFFTDIFNKISHAAKEVVRKVDHGITTVIHKVAPPKLKEAYDKLHNAIDPVHLEEDLINRINFEATKIADLVIDDQIIADLNAVVQDMKIVHQAAEEVIKGPCGPHAFVQRIPPWFKQQVQNSVTFVGLVKDGAQVTGKMISTAPHVLELAMGLESIAVKLAQDITSKEHMNDLKAVAANFRKSVQAIKSIPTAIHDVVQFIEDVDVLVVEGATCAGSLATDIKEGVAAIAEGLGGIAACTTGVGCLEELLTLKDIAIGAVSTLVSDASCALTVAKAAKDGAKDIKDLIDFLSSLTSIIKEVSSIKKELINLVEILAKIEGSIKKDAPAFKQKLTVVAGDIDNIAKDLSAIIPKVDLFANTLLLQFKSNIHEMMICKSKVEHVILLSGKEFVDATKHVASAAEHLIKMQGLHKEIKAEIELTKSNALNKMKKDLNDIHQRAEAIKADPLTALKNIPHIIEDAVRLPIDIAAAEIKTLKEITEPKKSEASQKSTYAKADLEKAKAILAKTRTIAPPVLPIVSTQTDEHLEVTALTNTINAVKQNLIKPLPEVKN